MSTFAGELSAHCFLDLNHVKKMCHQDTIEFFSDQRAVLGSDGKIACFKETGWDVVIMMDGHLFNVSELKEECKNQGHPVQSDAVEELIFRLYQIYREEFMSLLNGAFSIVLVDRLCDLALLIRDPMGLKPLFYHVNKESVIFGSLIRCVLKHPSVKAQAGAEELMEMMLLGPSRTPGKTYFKGIDEVKPGYYLSLNANGIQSVPYFFLKDEPWSLNEEKTIKFVHDLVSDAIQRQSDGSCCALLSGGLDSSVVCAKAYETSEDLRTYSVDYVDQSMYFKPNFYQKSRDQDYIELMKERYPFESHEVVLSHEALRKSLKDAMLARDLPSMADVDSSLYCFLEKMKEMGESVALSGECADELFGGYPWYTQPHLCTLTHFPWISSASDRLSYLKEEFRTMGADNYIKMKIRNTLSCLTFHKDTSCEERQMKKMMKLNLDWFMQTLTDRADRMARAFNMEIRVPFCDVRLVQVLYQIPWSMKYQDGMEKSLLRKAFVNELPDEIVHRKKSPYPKTHHPEYARMIKEDYVKMILDDDNPIHQILRKEKLEELIYSEMKTPWYGQLMTVPQTMAYFLQINDWLKAYDVEIIHPKG